MKNFIKNNLFLVVITVEVIVFFFASLIASVVFSNPELVSGLTIVITYTFYDMVVKPRISQSETK